MKRTWASLSFALLIPPPVLADTIYRCEVGGTPVYQDTECTDEGKTFTHLVTAPSAEAQRAARNTARKEKNFVAQVEAERDARQRAAAKDRARDEKARSQLAERCAEDERLIKSEETTLQERRSSHRSRARAERAVREARDRVFSNCLGQR